MQEVEKTEKITKKNRFRRTSVSVSLSRFGFLQKRIFFLSFFPMFVPSLSWHIVGGVKHKMAK
jgi:hypothetical protein